MDNLTAKNPSPRQMRRAIYALAFPIVGTNLLLRGVGIVDTALIGHISATSQAAVGMAQWIVSLMMAIMQGLALGGTVAVANFTGAEDDKNRIAAADTTFWLAVISSLIITAAGLIFVHPIATAMGADKKLFDLLAPYMLVMNLFFISKGLLQAVSGIFQGYGDTRTPFRVIVGVNIVHLVIAYPLTFGVWGFPRLEILGVALASGISETLGAIALTIFAYRSGLLKFKFHSAERLRQVLALGVPVIGERVLMTVMQMTYTRMVLVTSLSAYAAHSIGIMIEGISFLPGVAFAQAATTLVGQNLGARQPHRARRYGNQTMLVGLIVMGVVALTFWFFPGLWMAIFSNNPEVIEYGKLYCKVAAVLQIPMGISMVLSGSLRGAGQTRFVMYSAFLGGWMVRLPFAYYMGNVLHLGILYIWLAMPLDWIARTIMLYIKYASARWHEG